MPFWKKSEDPWDMEPGKEAPAADGPEREGESLPDTVREWGARIKTALQKKEAPEGPPETCPWCGKEMEKGYITGGRDAVRWSRGKPGFLGGLGGESLRIDDEGGLFCSYRTAWYCRDCRKLVADVPEPAAEGAFEEHVREYQARQEKTKEKET